MRSPAEVQQIIAKRWERSVPAWLADPAGAEISVPLHPPSATEALSDPAGVAAWIAQWQSAPAHLAENVHWEARRWAQLGTQRLPVRWGASGGRTLCRAAGPSTLRDWELLSSRYEAAVTALANESAPAPDTEGTLRHAIAKAMNRMRAQWLRMHDIDAEISIRAAAWFLANPASGLRIRQVPLPGMHTKWLQQHRALVGWLVSAARADDSPDLGLAPAPVFHDVLVLDPDLRSAHAEPRFPRASRIDISMLPELGLAPRAVIICENSETVQVLPDLPGTIAISGAGYDIRRLLEVPWVQAAPVIYWGDIDADGLRILDRARHHHPAVRSILMDRDTLATFRELTVTTETRPATTTRLTRREQALHDDLSASGERLEQERIALDVAVEALREAVTDTQQRSV